MKVGKLLTIEKEFSCWQGDCPNSCCKGFYVPVKKCFGRCIYFTKENKCKLQLEQHEDMLPTICRLYPKLTVDYGEWSETTLQLSCPSVAKLVLQKEQPITFYEGEAEETLIYIQNQSKKDLYFWYERRQELLDFWWQGMTRETIHWDSFVWQQKLQGIYDYSRKLQDLVLRNQMDLVKKNCQLVLPEIAHGGFGFYDFYFADQTLMKWVYHEKLAWKNPLLYENIKVYNKVFGKLTQEEAMEHMEQYLQQIEQIDPQRLYGYVQYFSIFLLQKYLFAYEDYHGLRQIMVGFLFLQWHMMLDGALFLSGKEKKGRATWETYFSALEKRIRHNQDMALALLDEIRTLL